MSLEDKSLTELRGNYSAMGGSVNFGDPKNVLLQKIKSHLEYRTRSDVAPTVIYQNAPQIDDNTPIEQFIREALSLFIDRGLKLSFSGNEWVMSCGKKSDSGSITAPINIIFGCAREVVR